MTISFVGLGTYAVSNGSSPMFPTPHASATADDLHILLVGWKADSGIDASGLMPHIDGWVPLGAAYGGAMDNLCQFAYYRIGTPTTPKVVAPNFVVTDGFAQQIHYRKTAAYWDIGWCGVDDNTWAANLSATTYTYQTFQPVGGDIILALIGLEYLAVVDQFARTNPSSWGSTPSGYAWTTSGPSTTFSTDGSGIMTIGAAPAEAHAMLDSALQWSDAEVRFTFLPVVDEITGDGGIAFGAVMRVDGSGDGYYLRCAISASHQLRLNFFDLDTGASLGSTTVGTWDGSRAIRYAAACVGTTLKAKVWHDGDAEPDWQFSLTDSTYSTGAVWLRGQRLVGNTNDNLELRFDDFQVARSDSPISADTFTQSGVTFGTVTVHTAHDSPDFHFRVLSAPVAAGSTTATITYSHTNAANNSGSGIILRLNEYNLTSGEVKRRTPQPWSVPRGTSTNIALPMMSTFDDGNNLHIAFIGIKPFDAEIVPPEGWRLLAEITNGTTGSGVDTGSVKVVAYYKFGTLLDQTSHGIPIAQGIVYEWLASSSSVWIGWIETYSKYSARPWALPLAVVGTDSSHGANYSATATATLAATAPDALLAFTFVNTDEGTRSSIGLSLPGATLGTLLTFLHWGTGLGDDAAAILNFAQVVSGTGSGSPQLTFTNASSSSGATIFVCLRQNPEVTATVSAPPSGFSLDEGRYIINLTNIYPYLDALSIVRISDTNNYRPEFVVSAEVVETPMEFYDYEFHYAATDSNDIESFHYQIDFYIGTNKVGEVLTSSVTPHTDRLADPNYTTAGQHPGTYIKNPRAELCMPVTIGSFDSYRREGRILGEHHILGNPYPVVVTDLMSSMRGRFSILVYADANWIGTYGVVRYLDELRELFDVGQPLYFQTIWPWMSGIPDFHFVVRSYEVNRRSRVVHMNDDDDRSPIFEVTVEFVETAPPGEESILTPITWASLAQNYNLWKHMTAANVTWLDVLNDG